MLSFPLVDVVAMIFREVSPAKPFHGTGMSGWPAYHDRLGFCAGAMPGRREQIRRRLGQPLGNARSPAGRRDVILSPCLEER